MENYLCHIKTLVDIFAAIQSSVSDLELIEFITSGIPLIICNYLFYATW